MTGLLDPSNRTRIAFDVLVPNALKGAGPMFQKAPSQFHYHRYQGLHDLVFIARMLIPRNSRGDAGIFDQE